MKGRAVAMHAGSTTMLERTDGGQKRGKREKEIDNQVFFKKYRNTTLVKH